MLNSCKNWPVALFDIFSFSATANFNSTLILFPNVRRSKQSFSRTHIRFLLPSFILDNWAVVLLKKLRHRLSETAIVVTSTNERQRREPHSVFTPSALSKGQFPRTIFPIIRFALSSSPRYFIFS